MMQLEKVIDIEILEKIQDDFSEATGFAAITVDYLGKSITKHSGCTAYCSIIRSRPETKDLCEKCDSRAGLEAARTGKPYIYMCHSGFLDFAAPIMVNGHYLGAIMGGQVLVTEKNAKVKYIVDETVDIEDDVELIEAYSQIPIVPYEKLEAAANMMFNIANAIAEKSYNNFMQQQLHEQSLQLIESRASELSLQAALKEAELKTLQYQINRKFLLQMLSTIGNLSFIENASKTEETTYTFIEVVKFLLQHINKEITGEEERNYLEYYLSLQKTRLGNKLSYHIHFAEEAKHVTFPSMLIHPLVENSIIHGIETKAGAGKVEVIVEATREQIIITVKDNGIGISKEKRETLFHGSSSPMSLSVLKDRLYESYHELATILINSTENVGTIVTVSLPRTN